MGFDPGIENPIIPFMQTEYFHLATSEEYRTQLYAWLPDDEPRIIIHIVHGMAEHAKRYAAIAAKFTEDGYAVFANENRAHGTAVKSVAELGIGEANWYYKQIEDLKIIINYLHQRFPGKPVFLFGHSMGSFLCQRYFQLYGKNLQGLILSATNGQPDPLLNLGVAIAYIQYKACGTWHRSALINKLSFGKFNSKFKPNRTNHDWLSRDETEVDKYVADERCGFVCSAGFFYYFFKGLRDTFKELNLKAMPRDIPVYCFAGSEDPVGFEGKGFLMLIRTWQKAGIRDIEYKLYQNGRHEMLNETNRAEVLSDLERWLAKHK